MHPALNERVVDRVIAAQARLPFALLVMMRFVRQGFDETPGSGYDGFLLHTLREHGGELLWLARGEHVLVGDESRQWDVVMLIQFPDNRSLVPLAGDEEFADGWARHAHLVEDVQVIGCSPMLSRFVAPEPARAP